MKIAMLIKEISKAICMALSAILLMTIAIASVMEITHESDEPVLNEKALEVLHDMKEASNNPPQYYY